MSFLCWELPCVLSLISHLQSFLADSFPAGFSRDHIMHFRHVKQLETAGTNEKYIPRADPSKRKGESVPNTQWVFFLACRKQIDLDETICSQQGGSSDSLYGFRATGTTTLCPPARSWWMSRWFAFALGLPVNGHAHPAINLLSPS